MRRALTVLLIALPIYATAEMNFIPLQHRNAEELVPLLRPVLDEGVGLTGRGDTLIVNAPPESLAQIRTLVKQLDTPLERLQITVIQGDDSSQQRLHGSASGSLESPTVRIYGTQSAANNTLSQRLQVLEGQWATIRTGEQVPVVTQHSTPPLHGPFTTQGVEYKNVESGFEVKPQLRGNEVTLEVRPFRARRAATAGGVIEQQELVTTVSGHLGEWLELGGVAEQQHDVGAGTVYATRSHQRSNGTIRLKVERLPQ